MVDKVQEKSEGSETSLFHHGLMKLLILDELQKIGRDWSSFLFINCFELETLTPVRNPKAKGVPSPPTVEPSQPMVAKPKETTRVKPRKKIEKRED